MWGENVPTAWKVMGISSPDPGQANQLRILSQSVWFYISISLFYPPVLGQICILVEKIIFITLMLAAFINNLNYPFL